MNKKNTNRQIMQKMIMYNKLNMLAMNQKKIKNIRRARTWSTCPIIRNNSRMITSRDLWTIQHTLMRLWHILGEKMFKIHHQTMSETKLTLRFQQTQKLVEVRVRVFLQSYVKFTVKKDKYRMLLQV